MATDIWTIQVDNILGILAQSGPAPLPLSIPSAAGEGLTASGPGIFPLERRRTATGGGQVIVRHWISA